MEAALIWLNLHPWVVESACDVVTVTCYTAVVLLLIGRARSTTVVLPKMVRGPEPAPAAETNGIRARVRVEPKGVSAEPFGSPVKRRLVNDALEAMSRWEATYRPGRGLDDLARFTRDTRNAAHEPAEVR